jgi:hypothetical protein
MEQAANQDSLALDLAVTGQMPVSAADALQMALAITAEVFPGPAEVHEEFHPAHPEHRWQTIVVRVDGEVNEVVDRSAHWHRRMLERLGVAGADITIRVLPVEP